MSTPAAEPGVAISTVLDAAGSMPNMYCCCSDSSSSSSYMRLVPTCQTDTLVLHSDGAWSIHTGCEGSNGMKVPTRHTTPRLPVLVTRRGPVACQLLAACRVVNMVLRH
jgi:hypothetical protein